eukprot:EG_transcript_19563
MVRFPPEEAMMHEQLLEAHRCRLQRQPHLHPLYTERVHSYDLSTFNFRSVFERMYQCANLDFIHLPQHRPSQALCPTVLRALVLAGHAKQVQGSGRGATSKMNKRWRAFEPIQEFRALYRRFLREVIGPLVDDGSGRFIFQAEPALRCVMPGTHTPTPLHRDVDYLHCPSEVNFWVPVTAVAGNRSLYSESEPGRQDFHSFDVGPGQVVQFWGNQCEHYTLPNDTDTTRVSFDFRVTPWTMYEEYSPELQRRCKECRAFRIGSYWEVMDLRLPPTSTEPCDDRLPLGDDPI